jgi:predicted acetyltransferase
MPRSRSESFGAEIERRRALRVAHTVQVSDRLDAALPDPTADPTADLLGGLTGSPRLSWPTTAVRTSYLAGEREDSLDHGAPLDWLERASDDFAAYVRERRGVRTRWGVPSTAYWYVAGRDYLGTLVIRHRLTPELTRVGGHIGYHVVPRWRRQGHATRMLAAGLAECRALGLDRVLVTCDVSNEPSRRVILANGGVPDVQSGQEARFWIDVRAQLG